VKTAKKQFAELKADYANDPQYGLRELSVLLRRVAISVSPRAEVASLTGEAWLLFLDGSVKNAPFSQGIGRCLSDAPYRRDALNPAEFAELLQLCEDWLAAQSKRKFR
jgi:hypothetical protein